MRVKLCGMRKLDDILYANQFMPDYVGYVFAKSKRQVDSDFVRVLNAQLDFRIKSVGVFVNEKLEIVINTVHNAKLNIIQLHGDENLQYIEELRKHLPHIEIWKAVRVQCPEDILNADILPIDKLVLDAFSEKGYGGTGELANFSKINEVRNRITKPFFIAGGLNIKNIGNIASDIHMFGIDISGGVETDGYKDKNKIEDLMKYIRRI